MGTLKELFCGITLKSFSTTFFHILSSHSFSPPSMIICAFSTLYPFLKFSIISIYVIHRISCKFPIGIYSLIPNFFTKDLYTSKKGDSDTTLYSFTISCLTFSILSGNKCVPLNISNIIRIAFNIFPISLCVEITYFVYSKDVVPTHEKSSPTP